MTWDLPTETAATHELMIFFPSCSGNNANWNIGMILFSTIYSIKYILDILMAFWEDCTIYPKKSGKKKTKIKIRCFFGCLELLEKGLCLYKPKMIWSPVYLTIMVALVSSIDPSGKHQPGSSSLQSCSNVLHPHPGTSLTVSSSLVVSPV